MSWREKSEQYPVLESPFQNGVRLFRIKYRDLQTGEVKTRRLEYSHHAAASRGFTGHVDMTAEAMSRGGFFEVLERPESDELQTVAYFDEEGKAYRVEPFDGVLDKHDGEAQVILSMPYSLDLWRRLIGQEITVASGAEAEYMRHRGIPLREGVNPTRSQHEDVMTLTPTGRVIGVEDEEEPLTEEEVEELREPEPVPDAY